jgi:hypothetical protein
VFVKFLDQAPATSISIFQQFHTFTQVIPIGCIHIHKLDSANKMRLAISKFFQYLSDSMPCVKVVQKNAPLHHFVVYMKMIGGLSCKPKVMREYWQ